PGVGRSLAASARQLRRGARGALGLSGPRSAGGELMATTMAALPSAGGARPRNLVATGTALLCAGATTGFGALMAAYVELRSHTQPWPPKGVKIDEYLGNMLIITMLLGSLS